MERGSPLSFVLLLLLIWAPFDVFRFAISAPREYGDNRLREGADI